MRVLLDIEASNLLPYVDRIFCIVVTNLDTGEIWSYNEGDREKFVKDSAPWTEIAGHGILSYDCWVLWLVWGLPFAVGPDMFNDRPVKFVDSLVLSRYLHPDRGGHGLFDFGNLLNFRKTEWVDFTEFSEEMLAYCENDVRLNVKVLKYLLKEKDHHA